MNTRHIVTAARLAIAAALIAPAAAFAQDSAGAGSPPQDAGIGEIIVTAQKRQSSLQDTPIAISAFSGEAMEDRGIDDVSNLSSYVPNLHVGQEQDGFKISLRGIGLQGTSSISDSGVAFYIDNFYIPRPAGGSAVFYDVERVEVLRGPQGTLYGRNATGGVANVISRAPKSVFEAEVGASYGSRNLFEARGVINVPAGENVAARVSAVYTREDGYVKNIFPGGKAFNGSDGDFTTRGQLKIGRPETIELLLSATYSKLNGSGLAMDYLERNIGGPPPVQAFVRTLPADSTDPLIENNNVQGYNGSETTIAFAKVTKDFGGVEAVIQAGKLWQTSNVFQDFDGSPLDISTFRKDQKNDAGSIEARLASSGGGPFTWILGGYYFVEDTFIVRRVQLAGLTPGGRIQLPDFLLHETGHSSTIAGFVSGTLTLADGVRANAGARYTHDEKRGTKRTLGNFGQPFPADIPNGTFPGEAKFDKLTWRGGLEWDAARDVLVYASVSNGYKAGGFNITSNGAPYNPEEVMAYEFGIKSDLFDRRARVNIDTFYYAYSDMQLTTLMTINNAPGQFTTNAGKSTIWGIEIDTQFKVTPELLFSASYAYINAVFDQYYNRDPRNPTAPLNPADPAGLGRTNLAGNKVPYVAEHTINLGLQYEAELGSAGRLTAAVNSNFHSEKFLREYNDRRIDRVGPGTKTDVTITWHVAETGLKLTGYVTNLENRVERNNVYISPGFIGESATTAYTKPRTVGVRADFKF